MTHAAMNIITGEVLTSTHGNQLKRRVARNTRWDVAHGYGAGVWVFAHGSNWQSQFADKLDAHRK